jgi:toxin-antitoxin system PIN domain toxin
LILLDVNVLVYAHREDTPDHDAYRQYIEAQLAAASPFGISELVLSGFLRVVTHPKVFRVPTPLPLALEFAGAIRSSPNCVVQSPGPRHWELFTELCTQTNATGNVIPDAYHAALALETASDWITTDSGFGRFAGLRWRHPLRRVQ